MVRKAHSAIAVLAIAAISIVGCTKEDVKDLNETWTKAENDLNTKLADFHKDHQEIVDRFQMVQTMNLTDTAKMADRKIVDQMIQDHEKAVGEVEKTANDLKAKREELLKTPKHAEFEAAWKDADVKFASANEALDKINSQHGEMKSKINNLGKGGKMDSDTSAAYGGAKMGKDTTAKMKKKDTTAKID